MITVTVSGAGHRRRRGMDEGLLRHGGFLRAVLRTANIPVAQTRVAGHALVHLVREGLFLSHGDDPYGGLSEATPPFQSASCRSVGRPSTPGSVPRCHLRMP